jgi:hypothetical protein
MYEHHYKTWSEAAGLPEVSVPLAQLPAGLEIPEDFPEPISFDPQRKRLVYRGFMCAASFQFLQRLNPDWPYRDALYRLFMASANVLDRPRAGRRSLRWAVAAGSMIAGTAACAWLLVR